MSKFIHTPTLTPEIQQAQRFELRKIAEKFHKLQEQNPNLELISTKRGYAERDFITETETLINQGGMKA